LWCSPCPRFRVPVSTRHIPYALHVVHPLRCVAPPVVWMLPQAAGIAFPFIVANSTTIR